MISAHSPEGVLNLVSTFVCVRCVRMVMMKEHFVWVTVCIEQIYVVTPVVTISTPQLFVRHPITPLLVIFSRIKIRELIHSIFALCGESLGNGWDVAVVLNLKFIAVFHKVLLIRNGDAHVHSRRRQ